jgi:hypothetical protein
MTGPKNAVKMMINHNTKPKTAALLAKNIRHISTKGRSGRTTSSAIGLLVMILPT